MTKADIISIAREAGFDPHDMSDDFTCNLKDIERLCKAAYAAGVAAEREKSLQLWTLLDKAAYAAGVAAEKARCAALCSEVAAGRDAEAIEEATLARGEK